MKRKDVENRIKTEAEKISPPEVYERVSRAPLSLLPEGGTPRAFRKRLVTMLLVFVLAIFCVLTIALVGMAFTNDYSAAVGDSYVSVTLWEGSETERIAFIADASGDVKAAVNETTKNKLAALVSKNILDTVSEVYAHKNADKVLVSVLNDDRSLAAALAENISSVLSDYDEGITADISVCAEKDFTDIVEFIVLNGGEASAEMSAEILLLKYASVIEVFGNM